jgi:serine/threonine-protein kinase RsbW
LTKQALCHIRHRAGFLILTLITLAEGAFWEGGLIKHSQEQIRLPAVLDNLRPLLRFIDDYGLKVGLDGRSRQQVEVAADEILTNIINYAYPEGGGEIRVTCNIDPSGRLSVEIVDGGIPFNPLEAESPALPSRIEEQGIGGLGILLAKRLVDEIRYRRENNLNILTLHKKGEKMTAL